MTDPPSSYFYYNGNNKKAQFFFRIRLFQCPYYTEQCGEILNFVAIAVASGGIGNVSYDIVKKVPNKLKLYVDREKRNREDERVSDFLDSSDKIKKFSEYISAYYDEYEGADERTKNAIMEEVFVD